VVKVTQPPCPQKYGYSHITQATALLIGLRCRYVLAEKGYDSSELIEQIQAQGSQPVIPPRTCQKPRFYDKAQYRLCNVIERCFSRLKQYRRIATRYDRKPANFLAFVYLASLACSVR